MVRVHGMKVIYLTTGGLMNVLKYQYDIRSQKVYHEKSAEAIVFHYDFFFEEGLNLN